METIYNTCKIVTVVMKIKKSRMEMKRQNLHKN